MKKIKREIRLMFYSLFSIITFHKYYICEECHKVHKRTGNEFKAYDGWCENHIFVSMECANKLLNETRKLLNETILERYSYMHLFSEEEIKNMETKERKCANRLDSIEKYMQEEKKKAMYEEESLADLVLERKDFIIRCREK